MPGLEGGPTYSILRTPDGVPHLHAYLEGVPDETGTTTMCGEIGVPEALPHLTAIAMCPRCLAVAHPEDVAANTG